MRGQPSISAVPASFSPFHARFIVRQRDLLELQASVKGRTTSSIEGRARSPWLRGYALARGERSTWLHVRSLEKRALVT